MNELETRLQQVATMLQGYVGDENHPLGKLFRVLGELQTNTDAAQGSGATEPSIAQFQQQMAALNLDDEQRSELQTALASAAREEAAGTVPAAAGFSPQILNDLVAQLNSIDKLIRDPQVNPQTALSSIRPFYDQLNSVLTNVAGSFNLNGNALLGNLQTLLRNQTQIRL
ncbi:hypothetical protein [Paenibacillus antibioticophila]|uniref:hypothetical protein n=1 Tax=Paenibacillus antibioticophila TaxID=1274374 RepID=UPI0005C841FD|nr:hypothetical protein [Paenibacillus antibioticophila]